MLMIQFSGWNKVIAHSYLLIHLLTYLFMIGELKLRVRVLESERSFQRMELVQNNMALAIAASGFLNVGMAMAARTTPTGQMSAKLFLLLAGLFGVQIPVGLIKLKQLDKKFKSFTG